MAISENETYGLLHDWVRVMQVNPWLFGQIEGSVVNAARSEPAADVFDQPERERVSQAVRSALFEAVEILGFYHRPVYVTETIDLDPLRGYQRGHLYKLPHGHIRQLGRRASTLINAALALTYGGGTDFATHTYAELTISPAPTYPNEEVQIFFKDADRPWGLADSVLGDDPRWEIEPVTKRVSGGDLIIRIPKHMLVSPSEIWANPRKAPNWNETSKVKANPSNVAHFVTEVAAYRVYTDTTNPATLLLDPNYSGGCYSGTLVNGWVETAGEATIYDSKDGFITLGGTNFGCHGHNSSRLRVEYVTGLPLKNGYPDPDLLRAIIRLSNCRFPAEASSLDERKYTMWQNDTSILTVGEDEVAEESPLGPRIGEVYAWKIFNRLKLSHAGAIY